MIFAIIPYMKIGIDTFGCDHARSGLGSYVFSFVSNLGEYEKSFELFGSELDRFAYTSGKNIPFVPASVNDNLSAERLWHFTGIAKFLQKQKYDAVLYPAPEKVLPVSFKTTGIAVVNSILSNQVEGRKDWTQKLQIKRGLYKVHHIIAASQYIKNDLVKHGIDQEKIDVVYNGIDHKLFFQPMNLDSDYVDVKPFSIKRPYFVYGSRLSGPEKKHVELIKGFSLFKQQTGAPHRLVISGDGPYASEVHKAAFQSPFASDIFLTGFFPREGFAQLYSGSSGCVFPSVCEGVGLPVLEAMATGVPVACSNAGALPEITGGNAVLFDSDDISQIASSLSKIVSDNAFTEGLVHKSVEWTRKFEWETTVKQTFDVAQRVCQSQIK